MEQNTPQGTFKSDLMKNFRQLKESRAASVSEDVETLYKRKIEDMCQQIRRYNRNREDLMLDLAPQTSLSNSVVPADFEPEDFYEKDMGIGINKREILIRLEIALERYENLFGEWRDKDLIHKCLPDWTSIYSGTPNTEEE